MTEEIRKAAEALIEAWNDYDKDATVMNFAIRDLKASLRPSREQLADYWANGLMHELEGEQQSMLGYTIEELRR